ncbi:MAG: hypothetical protein H6772_00735 [Pseudomonadales bacterium]|nr:hypothetical protein [Pseudomonadales bacterium]
MKKIYDDLSNSEEVNSFLKTIPYQNRREAIFKAKENLEEITLRIWLEELANISEKIKNKNNLQPNLQGWQNYLKLGFSKDKFRRKYGFDDWSTKYKMEMFIQYEEDDYRKKMVILNFYG